MELRNSVALGTDSSLLNPFHTVDGLHVAQARTSRGDLRECGAYCLGTAYRLEQLSSADRHLMGDQGLVILPSIGSLAHCQTQ